MVLYKDDILYADQTSKMKMILTTEPLKWKFGLNIPLQCVHIANPRLLPVHIKCHLCTGPSSDRSCIWIQSCLSFLRKSFNFPQKPM
jgi:hypothetical protein